jgi:ribosomal protein L37AE/L43A
MDNCPICSGQILRHINHHKIYWYCTHCHEKVPNFTRFLVSQKIHEVVTEEKRSYVTVKINYPTL